jgi:hypothetical protein
VEDDPEDARRNAREIREGGGHGLVDDGFRCRLLDRQAGRQNSLY